MQSHRLKVPSSDFRRKFGAAVRALGFWAVLSCPLLADDVLHISRTQLDRPTLSALGVKQPITGDDNLNASVTVKYRVSGSHTSWAQAPEALPLFRVHPEVVTQEVVTPNFAGSIFDLRANTAYDIQLVVSDPDGIVDETNVNLGTQTMLTLTGVTRAVPGDPVTPRIVNVNTAAQLTSALSAAQAGDIITLAAGTYSSGNWQIASSGTLENPIVIRGANTFVNGTYTDLTILDGRNCQRCNVLEVYGSYIHVEYLTIQNAVRAIRTFNPTTANVFRRLHFRDTDYGIMGSNSSVSVQTDFYIADNIMEGRIAWPKTCLTDKTCRLSSVDGIGIYGHGHVVAHNRVSGYGDAIANWLVGARANDFYGNDILWTYDDTSEMDGSEGNVRYSRNRLTNMWEGPSLQPINGGPLYIFRNVVVNVQNEQLKMHPNGSNPPSGMLAFNNTFVSAGKAWNNQTSATCHYFVIENNLFVGPSPQSDREVDVTCNQDHWTLDYDSYNTDGKFSFVLGGVYTTFDNFRNLQTTSPLEHNGQLLTAVCANGSVFANCLIPPADSKTFMQPQDVTPGAGSRAIDRALLLPNVNDHFVGAGPDVGAVEVGCAQPIYGPRPEGTDENKVFGCNGYQ
ncbi:MAG: hypothetical protein DMG05_03975 [Acidobacteria bacterium]|nr:MAG: hypothetical protein DMG05_03975 [Acidobacteriota bacterium]